MRDLKADGERNRFPLVERALADVPALADPEFAAGIRRHAENLVRRSRGLPGTYSTSYLLFIFRRLMAGNRGGTATSQWYKGGAATEEWGIA